MSKRGNRKRSEITPPALPKQKTEVDSSLVEKVEFERVLRYVAVVESRNVYFENMFDCNSEVGALVPVLEMFNHNQQAQCRVEMTSISYKVITTTAIRKGEQVFVNYGNNYAPDQLLEFYGMLPNYTEVYEKENLSQAARERTDKNKRRSLAVAYNSIPRPHLSPPCSGKKEPLWPRF